MKTIVPFKILSLKGQGFHLALNCSINHLPSTLLIDTGASNTVIDQERLAHFQPQSEKVDLDDKATGLGTQEMNVQTTKLRSFLIGKLERKRFRVGLLDLSHVRNSYEALGLPAFDGVLGSDFLKRHKAVINYSSKKLTLIK